MTILPFITINYLKKTESSIYRNNMVKKIMPFTYFVLLIIISISYKKQDKYDIIRKSNTLFNNSLY